MDQMSNKFDGLYNIRTATTDDRNFVLKSFLLGIYYGDSWFSKIPKAIFMNNYKKVAAALFDNPRNMVVVACLPDDPSVILGYSIISGDGLTLHWVYVKKDWRNRGIMTRILPQSINCVTHLTELGIILLKKSNKPITFNPFL